MKRALGTTNPPCPWGTKPGPHSIRGALANDKTYYWRIDEVNSYGTTTGTVWSFTTAAGGQQAVHIGDKRFDPGPLSRDLRRFQVQVRRLAGKNFHRADR